MLFVLRWMSTNYDFLSIEGVLLFLSPIKQRIRDSFAEATESREIFRELGKFVNPSDTSGFTARKKPVGWLAEIHLVEQMRIPQGSSWNICAVWAITWPQLSLCLSALWPVTTGMIIALFWKHWIFPDAPMPARFSLLHGYVIAMKSLKAKADKRQRSAN